MSREKTERLFNLTLALLGTRNYLTKSQILNSVQGYGGSSESADRMFERDKDELRELGIPLQVRQIDPLFDDEPGYRIDRGQYQLPPLTFTAQEMALLSVAAEAWEQAALSKPAAEGLRKLIAAGADPEPNAYAVFSSLRTQEPGFTTAWQAVRDSQQLSFQYRRSGESAFSVRHIDPWGLLARNGLWYLIGRDRDRDQPRVFRLSRMSELKVVGRSGAFKTPENVDIWSHAHLLDPQLLELGHLDRQQARLRITPNHAITIANRGVEVESDVYLIDYVDEQRFAVEVAAFSDSIEVIEPETLRARVRFLFDKALELYG